MAFPWQHDLAIGELERVMIHVKHAPVDLAKDRNGVAGMGTKHEGGLILDWRLEREFGTRKYADSHRAILRRGKSSCAGAEVSLSFRRPACAPRSRARSNSATGSARAPGRVRFPRRPFDALLARMAALTCFAAPIWPLRFSERSAPIKTYSARLREPSRANLGGAWS